MQVLTTAPRTSPQVQHDARAGQLALSLRSAVHTKKATAAAAEEANEKLRQAESRLEAAVKSQAVKSHQGPSFGTDAERRPEHTNDEGGSGGGGPDGVRRPVPTRTLGTQVSVVNCL